MGKKTTMILSAFFASALLHAQQADTLAVFQQRSLNENADFSFTESQLGDDDDAGQTVAAITGIGSDLYLSEVGYLFSPMRFRLRAYRNTSNGMFINGVQFNDVERGVFSYSSIGGLNDVTRNREGSPFFLMNNFGYTPVGGADDINLRAGQYAAGHKITLSGTNRNYRARGMYTYSTGMMSNGWAFTGSVGYRWANEGFVEGTFYNSFSYLFGFEKRFNDRHSLSFTTWGSPTERAQQGSSTEEAYWLANDHYYNPNWGYQNGKKRNARVVNSFEPTAILTWDFDIDDRTSLSTSFSGKYSMYANSALGWSGNAADPRPDYYKKLPSGQVDVWTEDEYTDEEIAYLAKKCEELEVPMEVADVWGKGGEGTESLARLVSRVAEECVCSMKPLYDWNWSVEDKIKTVATELYGAAAIDYTPEAKADLKKVADLGLDKLPVCIAKTQKSLSDNPKLLGRPKDFVVTVRQIEVAAGAGFVIPITGTIMRMPGLPETPAAEKIDIDNEGHITGLF